MSVNPFDPAPDRELGAWLRDALDHDADPALTARIRRAVAGERREQPLEVLARWFRPALAAAAVVAMVGLALWMRERETNPDLAAGPTAVQVLVAETEPAHELVLARFMEDR